MTFYKISNFVYRYRCFNLSKFLDKFFFLFHRNHIPGSAQIGKGTKLAYGGLGVVIHASSKIGRNVIIGQGVTIGAKEAYSSKELTSAPTICDNCYIAAGARVLGDITIGHSSVIGANAVVISSCPPYSILAGMPATVIKLNSNAYKAIK